MSLLFRVFDDSGPTKTGSVTRVRSRRFADVPRFILACGEVPWRPDSHEGRGEFRESASILGMESEDVAVPTELLQK